MYAGAKMTMLWWISGRYINQEILKITVKKKCDDKVCRHFIYSEQ